MVKNSVLVGLLVMSAPVWSQAVDPTTDVIPAEPHPVRITFLGHGTLMLATDELVIHVDPWTKVADYATLPKADIVLITHAHKDHADADAVKALRAPATVVVANPEAASIVGADTVLHNGQSTKIMGVSIEAVPAYNIVHKRDNGEPFHPKGRDNGYVLSVGSLRVLIAGDTENTPELKAIEGVDVAFLPMNLPYTMTPDMVADTALALHPKILYPYHYGETDPQQLVGLLADHPEIQVRVRSLR